MAFDMFLQCYRNCQPSPSPRTIVEQAFASSRDPTDIDVWVLRFPNGGVSELFIGEEQEIWDLMFNGAPNSPELWSGIFEILKRTGSVLFWPGGGWVVTDEAVIDHLRPDILDGTDPVYVVSSPGEIPEKI
jgi:hypothetical protein